jgi:hypothetical protein
MRDIYDGKKSIGIVTVTTATFFAAKRKDFTLAISLRSSDFKPNSLETILH